MNDVDKKIFDLIKILIDLRIIRYKIQFWDSLGIIRQNGDRIKKGLAHFTPGHIKLICQVYNVNSNWIFDIEKNVFRIGKSSINKRIGKDSMPATPNNFK